MSKKTMLTLLSTAAISAVAALSVPVTATVAAPSAASKSAAANKSTNSLYIVRLAEVPVVAYDGGIKGLQATAPKKGQKIDPNSPNVIAYKSFLEARQNAVLASVGGNTKAHSYGYTFNGFSAELTAAQAAKLKATPGVVSVTKDPLLQLETATTPAFLGLSGDDGFYANTGAKGEGVIIGIVDSGIWPEHPSYSDRTGTNGNGTQEGKLDYQQIPGWNGRCVPGDRFNASNCNQKLIGARFYNTGWGGNAGITARFPFEFNSPRDWGGHGTHTSTTAGGNADVAVTGPAAVLGKISGIAPRARIAAYKVCWADQATGGGCWGSDSMAAIDQAVADGVDVINFSISGTQTNFLDPVEIAFLYAARAGVFVATSAGNSGPASSTVAHPSPWLTTVAAGTHDRAGGAGSVTLGNDATYNGASMAPAAVTAPFIDSEAAGLPGANATAVRLCFAAADNGGTAVLDPAKVAGKIVLCDRGTNARVNKSLAVLEAGGVGMVLTNVSASSLNADLHSVPSVHVSHLDRAAIKGYAATANATATIAKGVLLTTAAPYTAEFSSRGPLLGANGDLLKPDLIAPGQDILAGVAPPNNGGQLFGLYSGTSMSSPHIAGLAALFKELHPDWSPMAIKSALMTTGYDVLDGGTPAPNTNPVLIFRQGAGHVDPRKATDPGLVYDASWNDWLAFLCGTTTGVSELTCNTLKSRGYSTDSSDMNVASIAIGDLLLGTQTVKRKVTNVGSSAATYTASVSGMAGFTVTVNPASLTLAPGQTESFTLTVTRTTADFGSYKGGQLRWTDGVHTVRTPIVVRPISLIAPTSASDSYTVRFGYTGPFSATARGLVPSVVNEGSVSTGAYVDYTVSIPAGTTYARFAMFDTEVNPAADIDLEVYDGTGKLVASSGGGTSNETANLLNPVAGDYTVLVVGYETGTGPASYKLHTFVLGSTPAGNMTVTAPASATMGETATIGISTSGLTAGTRYLGSVAYAGTSGMPNPTIITINP